MTLRLATKGCKAAVDAFIDEGVRSGAMIVRGSRVVQWMTEAKKERLELVTRAIFLLNITKVGGYACEYAINLVVVDIPEGVESIGYVAFFGHKSLTTVSFLTTLRYIGGCAIAKCSSLVNVDLLHTNLQELDDEAFGACSELKSMTIPDSLQKFGNGVCVRCFKLVPSNIDVIDDSYDDSTSEVVAHLCSQQT